MRNPKVIVITGASSGLGAALAFEYARPGVTLCLTGRNSERLAEVAAKCKDLGAVVITTILDVRDENELAAWLLDIDKKTPVDLVIANAGVSYGTLGGEDIKQVKDLFATNVDGAINTIHPLIDNMVARKNGQIAIVSSMASFIALPSSPTYSASKAAVRYYGLALRGLLHKYKVNVSVIIPGYIATNMTAVNKFPMPFLMKAEKAAKIIRKELEKNKALIVFPKTMYFFIRLVNLLPLKFLIPLLASLPGKPNMKS